MGFQQSDAVAVICQKSEGGSVTQVAKQKYKSSRFQVIQKKKILAKAFHSLNLEVQNWQAIYFSFLDQNYQIANRCHLKRANTYSEKKIDISTVAPFTHLSHLALLVNKKKYQLKKCFIF